MEILIMVLRILGIVLMVVLGLLLLALLILLFVPFGYKAEGEFSESTSLCKVRFSWLLHLLWGEVIYEDGLLYGKFRFLWIRETISKEFAEEDEPEGQAEAEHSESEQTRQDRDKAAESSVEVYNTSWDADGTKHGHEVAHEDEADVSPYAPLRMDADEMPDGTLTEQSDENLQSTSTGEEQGANSTAEQEQKTKSRFKNKTGKSNFKDNFNRIKQILTDKQNHAAVKHLKDELVYLVKILLPKKSRLNGSFSTGSPDTTGQLFGFLACFPIMYSPGWALQPDFQAEKAYFKGMFKGKGRIFGYQLVGILARIVLDENCRRMYDMIRRTIEIMKTNKGQEDK